MTGIRGTPWRTSALYNSCCYFVLGSRWCGRSGNTWMYCGTGRKKVWESPLKHRSKITGMEKADESRWVSIRGFQNIPARGRMNWKFHGLCNVVIVVLLFRWEVIFSHSHRFSGHWCSDLSQSGRQSHPQNRQTRLQMAERWEELQSPDVYRIHTNATRRHLVRYGHRNLFNLIRALEDVTRVF